jgi:hypothetical protein
MSRRFVSFRLAMLLLIPMAASAAGEECNVLKYGAVGDGKTKNTEAINKAIRACAQRGGGTVVVPPGDYLSGPIWLASNITLRLEQGTVLRGSPDLNDYPQETEPWSGSERGRPGLISVKNAKNVAITGRGTVDGNALAFLRTDQVLGLDYGLKKLTRQGEDFMSAKFGTQNGPFGTTDRPGEMIRVRDCENVLLSGVTIQNSPLWTVYISNSKYVDVLGVTIQSPASDRRTPNDDGIDIRNCRYVHIADTNIWEGDDCIALFGVEDLTVTNCTLSSRSAAIRVGFDGGEIRNGVFSNLVIHTSNRGINVNVRGGGVIENLLFDNIVIQTQLFTGNWWGKAEPIHISALPSADAKPPGVIRNLRFTNISADSENGILIYGTKESIIQDVLLDHVKLKIKPGPLSESYGGNFDLRGSVSPELSVFKHDIPGLYCSYVDGLKIRGLELEWADNLPEFFSHGIECENFRNLEVNSFEGRQAHAQGKSSAISLSDGRGVTIRNSVAAGGTQIFLSHIGVTDALLLDNDLSKAKVAISPAASSFTLSGNVMPRTSASGKAKAGSAK